jgi:hypothetical protein
MKLLPVLLVAASGLCYMACMKGPDTKRCMLNTGSQLAPTEGTIVYTVKNSHKAFITTLTYHSPHGPVVVDTPELPFTVSVAVSKGATMSLSAEGTAIEGNLVAGYTFTGTGSVINQGDSCSN